MRQKKVDKHGCTRKNVDDEVDPVRPVLLEEEQRALDIALRLLSCRPRSKEEIRRKLQEKGFASGVRASVLEKLEFAGYIDDAKFTEMWVDYRIEVSRMGRHRISMELAQKGLPAELVTTNLNSVPYERELDAALIAAEKVLPRYSGLSQDTLRRRMRGVLLRRGFSCEIIANVFRALEI